MPKTPNHVVDVAVHFFGILILCLVFLIPIPATAQSADIYKAHPEWFQCQVNDDCVTKCEVCGDVVVNKEYSIHFPEIIPACLKNSGCAVSFGKVASAQCENNKCVVRFTKEGQ